MREDVEQRKREEGQGNVKVSRDHPAVPGAGRGGSRYLACYSAPWRMESVA